MTEPSGSLVRNATTELEELSRRPQRIEQDAAESSPIMDDDMDAVGEADEEHVWTTYSAIPRSPRHDVPLQEETQLPTPRTGQGHHGVFQPFFAGAVGSPQSPLAHTHPRQLGNLDAGPRIQSRTGENTGRGLEHSHPLTPAASPERRAPSAPSVQPLPLQSPLSDSIINSMKSEDPILLAPAHDISSRASSTFQSTPEPTHDLSSPFTQKPRQQTALGSSIETGPDCMPLVATSPMHEQPNANNGQVISGGVPPFDSTRKSGGELERIRSQKAVMDGTHMAEVENRRPEYFKRLHKEDALKEVSMHQDNGLGITVTPARGRRLQLFDFQTTSAESFEESLMTHGYGTYGEPRTPQRPLDIPEGLSQEAYAWLARATPAPPRSTDATLPEQNEREMKKRKRLEAFKTSSARACAKLYPAEVEGYGRIILNVPPQDADAVVGTPAKKRAMAKRKRTTVKRESEDPPLPPGSSEVHWLDSEPPWALREKERVENIQAAEVDRLNWLDKYFSHDTDSDDLLESDNEELPSFWDEITVKPIEGPRRGRGKTVTLSADPSPSRSPPKSQPHSPQNPRNLYFQSDPADARMALMSKRAIRRFAQRRRRESAANADQDRLACECGEDTEEKQAVQCDYCYLWYHLHCIGVRDESELGGKDEPWFCARCLIPENASTQEPVFVEGEEEPERKSAKKNIPLFSGSSPIRGWGSSSSLLTPAQSSARRDGFQSRRSIWDDVGPYTPSSANGPHVYSPGLVATRSRHVRQSSSIDGSSPFPFAKSNSFATPKNVGGSSVFGGIKTPAFGVPWTLNTGSVNTPFNGGKRYPSLGSAGYSFILDDHVPGMSGGMGMFSQGQQPHGFRDDDTPISRAPGRDFRSVVGLPPTGSGDSPLAGKTYGPLGVRKIVSPASPLRFTTGERS